MSEDTAQPTAPYARIVMPPKPCPCCNAPGFVLTENHRFWAECKNGCGVKTRLCGTRDTALWLWNRRFDGQYGITARELEATVVTRLRGWFDHRKLEYPPCLQQPERHPLEQVVGGCLNFIEAVSDNK
jgi:hypothetical protein